MRWFDFDDEYYPPSTAWWRNYHGGAAIPGAADFRSGSSVDYGARTDTVITAPAGIQDGDGLAIIFEIGAVGAPPAPTPPAGFGILPGFPLTATDGFGFTIDVYAWSKTAAAEAGNYTITHAAANSTAYMMAIEGGNTFSPNPSVNQGTGAAGTALGVTTVIDNSLIILWAGVWIAADLVTPPGGATPAFTTRYASPASILFVETGVLTPPGATGNKNFGTGNPGGEPWLSGLIAVRP
jgi:hypothetical protein